MLRSMPVLPSLPLIRNGRGSPDVRRHQPVSAGRPGPASPNGFTVSSSVSVPRATCSTLPDSRGQQGRQPQGVRVLLVENEPAMAKLVAGNIARHGFVVDQARSLAEA